MQREIFRKKLSREQIAPEPPPPTGFLRRAIPPLAGFSLFRKVTGSFARCDFYDTCRCWNNGGSLVIPRSS